MTWLDYLPGQLLAIAGVDKSPRSNKWNFVSGVTAVYNNSTKAWDLTVSGGGGGGVTDHGGLTGLSDDDHSALYELWARPIVAYSGVGSAPALADARKHITTSHGSANTFTIPPNSGIAFATGTMLFGTNIGAGTMTLTPGSGVTLNGPSLSVPTGYTWLAKKTNTNTWYCSVIGSASGSSLPSASAAGQTIIWNGSAYVAGALDLADTDAVTGSLPTARIADDAVTLDKLAQAACPQYRAVANAAARTGLPAGERNAGMLVRENDTGLLYVLAADLTTWVLADTSVTNQKISRASADAVGADMTLRKRRGTETSPAAVNAEDVLGSLSAQGHDGSGDYDAGRLRYVADAAGGTSKRSRVEQYLHDGTAFVKTEEAVTVRATTTDATLTVVRAIQLAADSVLRVRYGIVGAQNSSSNRAIRETSLTARRSGSGDPVVVAYGDSIPLTKDDATWGADTEIGHQVNTTTDELEIIVKGKAATTIVWRVDIVSSVR